MIAVRFAPKAEPGYCSAISNIPFPILRRTMLFLTKDYRMPKRLEAVDPAKSKALDCKPPTSANVVHFKRSSSFEVRPSQRLRPSNGGDPGPAGFDWDDLKGF